MFGGEGTWWVSSESDPRWNNSGRGWGAISAGGPREMGEWIDRCKKEYGDPSDDARMGFMKD